MFVGKSKEERDSHPTKLSMFILWRKRRYASSAWQSNFSRESDDNPSDIRIIIMLWHHNPHHDDEAPGVAGLAADAAPRLGVGALHQGAAPVQRQHQVRDPDLLHDRGPGGHRDHELPQPRDILPPAHRESRARDVQQQQGGEHLHPRQLLPPLPAQRRPHQGQHWSVSSRADIHGTSHVVTVQASTSKTSRRSMIRTSASRSMASSLSAGWTTGSRSETLPSAPRGTTWSRWTSVWWVRAGIFSLWCREQIFVRFSKYGYPTWRFWIWKSSRLSMFCRSSRGSGSIETLNWFTPWPAELFGFVRWLLTTFPSTFRQHFTDKHKIKW